LPYLFALFAAGFSLFSSLSLSLSLSLSTSHHTADLSSSSCVVEID
jgi:hypothetical protein